MKTNTFIWIALMLLCVASFSLREAGAMIILGAAAVKACVVGWQFMELRSAHPAWKLGFALLLLGALGLVGLLNGSPMG